MMAVISFIAGPLVNRFAAGQRPPAALKLNSRIVPVSVQCGKYLKNLYKMAFWAAQPKLLTKP
jgi:hypothetical protein